MAFTVGIAAGALVTNTRDGANRQASTRARTTSQVEGSTTGRGGGAASGDAVAGGGRVPRLVFAPHSCAQGAGSDAIIGDGVPTVGVRMKAGRWQTAGRPGCYWPIYAITGLPEDADFVDLVDDGNADGQTTVDLTPGQFFEIQDCPNWSRIG